MELCLAHDSGTNYNQLQLNSRKLDLHNFPKKFTIFYFIFSIFQNDLVHGWGLDFAFWRCVEVNKKKKPKLFVPTLFLFFIFFFPHNLVSHIYKNYY